MRDKIRNFLRKSPKAIEGIFILYNLRMHVNRILGRQESDSGATHFNKTTEESLSYILEVFNDYKKYGHVKKFHGRIAEIGPGDNFGVGLLGLADGAKQIDALDRFYSKRNSQQQAQIYQEMAETNPNVKRIVENYDLTAIETLPSLQYRYGEQASANIFFKDNQETFDFILSRSVLEHVDDPCSALVDMFDALKPGGKLIHKVDLRDHGMFTPQFHDIKYYEVPNLVYTLMTKGSGYPNRVLFPKYVDCLNKLNGNCRTYITQLAGVGPITPHVSFDQINQDLLAKSSQWVENHKRRFSHSLKKMPTKDLCPLGFFLVAEKGQS